MPYILLPRGLHFFFKVFLSSSSPGLLKVFLYVFHWTLAAFYSVSDPVQVLDHFQRIVGFFFF